MNRRPAVGAMLYGCAAIAAHLGVTKRQALRLVELGRIPVFREGRVICSTRPSLDTWLAEREVAAAATSRPAHLAAGAHATA